MEPQFYHKIAEAVGKANPILDIGCGEGRLTNFLARTLGSEVCGVDISDLKLTKDRETSDARDVSDLVWFVKGDASQLDFLVNDSFAAIVSIYVLHEFMNPPESLRELRRVLKASGKFIVVDFVKGGEAERLWAERYYTPCEIESMLKEAGFTDIAMEFVYDDVVFVTSRMSCTRLKHET